MEVRAQTEIKENEEITTRYFGPWEGQPSRQLKIQENWKFLCNCPRCKDPSDLGTYFSAIKCLDCSDQLLGNQNEGCNEASNQCGYLLPIDVEVLGSMWECNSCSKTKTVIEIKYILEEVEGSLKNMKSEISNALFDKSLSIAVQCIQESVNILQETLHSNHYLVFQFKKWVSQLSLPTKVTIPGANLNENANATDIMMNFEHQIAFLELQMKYHADVLEIEEKLDSGLTINRAAHYNKIAQSRIQLSKYKMLGDPDNYTKLQHMTQMKMAMYELMEVSKSYRYPENISIE
jgi:hypothetical protein